MPPGPDESAVVVYDSSSLVVLAASANRLLVMKAHAARAADIEDIKVLADRLGFQTAADVERLCATVMPDQPLSPRSTAVLREVFGT